MRRSAAMMGRMVDETGRVRSGRAAGWTADDTGRRQSFGRRGTLPVVTVMGADGVRAYEVRPTLWIGIAITVMVIATATIAAAGYLAFRDDIIDTAITRRMQIEQAYEDRIAALRSEIDRINSRQLIDQDAFETKIDKLMTRQDVLREQDQRLMGLIEKAKLAPPHRAAAVVPPGSLKPDSILTIRSAPPDSTPAAGDSIAPLSKDTPRAAPHPLDGTPLRQSWLERWDDAPTALASMRDRRSPALRIAEAEKTIDAITDRRARAMTAIAGLAETNSRAIETVVSRLGLRLAEADTLPPAPRMKPQLVDATALPIVGLDGTVAPGVGINRPASPERGLGGPFVPVMDADHGLARLEWALNRLDQLQKSVGLLPLGQPVKGAIEVTSPFGERPDPFLGVMAMHTGIDFRAAQGDPVIATGAGIVTEASRQGGYGNMIEIDHGNGISTRYGHLSHFAVTTGQRVKAGQIIGYAGSTGRSTAPHLHYETRVAGEAVNPTSYLDAGNRLRPLLN
ncbi:MAG: M23 family metallopeptidase [Ancalomicrobiaceae bacterium]|nr:M23 family metallopeptidase [Ancalomicrobiaceae bacterium]